LFITFPSEVIASAPTRTRSTLFINDLMAESTIMVASIPASSISSAVILPWYLGLVSVRITSKSAPASFALLNIPLTADEWQWVRILDPFWILLDPTSVILWRALLNSSSRSSAVPLISSWKFSGPSHSDWEALHSMKRIAFLMKGSVSRDLNSISLARAISSSADA